MEKILENIKKEIKETLNKNFPEKIVYLGGLGSQYQKAKIRKSKIIDIDLVYVFNELNEEILNLLDNSLEKIAKKYTNNNLDVIPITIHGPIKVTSSKKFLIISHNLVFDLFSFKNLVPLVKFSVQNTAHKYYGSDKFLKKEKVILSKDLVLNSPLGINDCIKMVKEKSTFQFTWDQRKEIFIPKYLKLKDEIYFEIICYAIARSTINLINFKEERKYYNFESIKLSEKEKIPNVNFLKETLKIKDKFRQKRILIEEINLEKLSNQALIYLNNLVKTIK